MFAQPSWARVLGDTGAPVLMEAVQASLSTFFKTNPDVHGARLQRLTLGRFVIDHERVTGVPGKTPAEVLLMYEVRGGKIVNYWETPYFQALPRRRSQEAQWLSRYG